MKFPYTLSFQLQLHSSYVFSLDLSTCITVSYTSIVVMDTGMARIMLARIPEYKARRPSLPQNRVESSGNTSVSKM
jgi:hypothetical protein